MQSVPRLSFRLRAAGPTAFAILLTCSMAATADLPPRLPAEAFGRLPAMTSVEISPGGRNIAAGLLDKSGHYEVAIFDLEQIGKKPPLRASTGEWDMNWMRWKSDSRLLISGRHSEFDGKVGIIQTRLIAVNADGSNFKWLVKGRKVGFKGSERPLFADRVIDFMAADPQHVLMGLDLGDSSGPRLYRVNIENDRRDEVESAKPWIQWWLPDQEGRVRVAKGYSSRESFDAHMKTYYRPEPDAEWRELWDETATDRTFQPVMFDKADRDVILVKSNHENGYEGLYRFRLSTGKFIETLFLQPDVDLTELVEDAAGSEIQGVRYVSGFARYEWLSPKLAGIHKEIQAQLPGWSIDILSRSADEGRMIVFASAPDHSGRFFLYETASHTLKLFANTYPELDPYDLARVSAVRFKARDGLDIPAYLTLPRGVANPPARALPTVVMPQGGPDDRDYGAFDAEVQMLANRGYAVLQINFRGSGGYGAAFRKAGEQQWGEAIQDDITDGTRWLIDSRIADPARICIAGSAFGGYAALMGVVKEQSLYKCAVSLNGFTDLPDYLNLVGHYGGNRRWLAERIGKYWTDGPKLARNSPARRATDIRVPVLLVQSLEDGVVPTAQGTKMAEALQAAGKSFRHVKLKDEDHWLSHGATRLQYFQELDAFLAEQLR